MSVCLLLLLLLSLLRLVLLYQTWRMFLELPAELISLS
jgi:hypothetical protein